MKRLWLILGLVVVLISLFFIVIKVTGEEKYFNKVDLSYNNVISNTINPSFYDTILSVGLDEMGIMGQTIVVSQLSDASKLQFNGELKAHIRYYNGVFYLFIDEYSRLQSIQIISHEIIHIDQYLSEQLVYENNMVIWETQPYDIDQLEYDNRPWERDAFDRENMLSSKINNILYEE
jgi:hypothetical protein